MLSALCGVSSPTHFINSGDRNNRGRVNHSVEKEAAAIGRESAMTLKCSMSTKWGTITYPNSRTICLMMNSCSLHFVVSHLPLTLSILEIVITEGGSTTRWNMNRRGFIWDSLELDLRRSM